MTKLFHDLRICKLGDLHGILHMKLIKIFARKKTERQRQNRRGGGQERRFEGISGKVSSIKGSGK